MFKNPFEIKNENSVVENMFNVIKEFCYRRNNQHDANLVDSMNTLMNANFEQFATIFPNMKNDILRNYDKKDKDFLNAYFKVIEDQIAQHHVNEVVNDIDVHDIEKLQEGMQLTPDQIRAAEELKRIVQKEKEEESFKDEVEHFVDATKDLFSYPMHKHHNSHNLDFNQKVNLQQELNSQINSSKNVSQPIVENVIQSKNTNIASVGDSNPVAQMQPIQNEMLKATEKPINADIQSVNDDKITNPIVNLILSQLKDVVSMMNELSGKMQEIEKNNLTAVSQLGDLKENVKNYNDRIETLENNVEKFIGLYEVFMNEYNPFLDNDKNK